MPKDMIAGCFDGYTWNRIQYFVNSADRSGFTGDSGIRCSAYSHAPCGASMVGRNAVKLPL